jgi:peptidoglycan/LPS O-acetylase OafA/YrhL
MPPLRATTSGLEYLGLFRFVLATSVPLSHLWNTYFPDAGRHAVTGFFCISGFLVTKIARETYNDRPLAFLVNRFLRIYPTYWTCLFVLVLAGLSFPELVANPFGWLQWPDSVAGCVNQMLIFNVAPASLQRLIPQSWSLENELYFYLIIGLGTYRSFLLTVIFFLIALAYAVLGIFHVVPIQFYWSPYGNGFMFFAGSLAYFLSSRILVGRPAVIAACVVYAISMYGLPLMLPQSYDILPFELFLLISVAAAFVILVGLPNIAGLHGNLARISSYSGHLAYPVFLLHQGAAIPIYHIVGPNEHFLIFVGAYTVTLVTSVLIINYIESPIEQLRRQIRNRNNLLPERFNAA